MRVKRKTTRVAVILAEEVVIIATIITKMIFLSFLMPCIMVLAKWVMIRWCSTNKRMISITKEIIGMLSPISKSIMDSTDE